MLEIQMIDPEPFTTEYSVNARVKLREGEAWTETILPLKSHTSNNASLLTKWTQLQHKGQLKEGRELKIKTWLGMTKKTDRSDDLLSSCDSISLFLFVIWHDVKI